MTEKIELDLEEIRAQLEKERNELLERSTASNGTSVINPDRTDLARSYDLRQRNWALESWAERKLVRIEQALERLEQGTYGYCENCGESISPERLKALPYATMCMRCKAQLER